MTNEHDGALTPDEKRRRAITAWWERMSIRNFIASKRAANNPHRSEDE